MRTRAAIVATIVASSLVACSAGSPSLADGTYRLFQSSVGSTSGTATLELAGTEAVFDVDGAPVTLTLTGSAGTFVLCPTAREGEPQKLSAPITVSGIEFAEPALYGDCGTTAPERVTLVDLSAAEDGSIPAFAEWVELCSVTDPDCPPE